MAGHYRRAAGALIVYDVTKRSTFEHVTNWLNNVNEMAEKNCLTYLIGNKTERRSRTACQRHGTLQEQL